MAFPKNSLWCDIPSRPYMADQERLRVFSNAKIISVWVKSTKHHWAAPAVNTPQIGHFSMEFAFGCIYVRRCIHLKPSCKFRTTLEFHSTKALPSYHYKPIPINCWIDTASESLKSWACNQNIAFQETFNAAACGKADTWEDYVQWRWMGWYVNRIPVYWGCFEGLRLRKLTWAKYDFELFVSALSTILNSNHSNRWSPLQPQSRSQCHYYDTCSKSEHHCDVFMTRYSRYAFLGATWIWWSQQTACRCRHCLVGGSRSFFFSTSRKGPKDTHWNVKSKTSAIWIMAQSV